MLLCAFIVYPDVGVIAPFARWVIAYYINIRIPISSKGSFFLSRPVSIERFNSIIIEIITGLKYSRECRK